MQDTAGTGTTGRQFSYVKDHAAKGASEDNQGDPCRGLQESWEAQWQEFLRSLETIHPDGRNTSVCEAAPWEDTKDFLASFEQVAKACQWPTGEWAARLFPALAGEAKQAFSRLEATDREDYGKVKAAILRVEGLQMEMQRQHFRQFSCQDVEDPQHIYGQVQELCHQWLKPKRHSKEQILELLILEQFLASLPSELQAWVRAAAPDTCTQAVALAEEFLMSQQVAKEETWQVIIGEEDGGTLHIVEPNFTKPGEQTVFLEALQEEEGSASSSDDTKGYIKVENSLWDLEELEDPSGVILQISQKNVLEEAEKQKLKWRSNTEQWNDYDQKTITGLQWKQSMEREREGNTVTSSSNGHPRNERPLFSKYGRRYHRITECVAMHPIKNSSNCHLSEIKIPHNLNINATCVDEEMDNKRDHQLRNIVEISNGSSEDEKSFPQREIFTVPQRNEMKPHRLAMESKHFSDKSNLNTQQENHADKKPLECSVCGKCFKKSWDLKVHWNTHTGVKPHKCPDCGKKFYRKHHMIRHRGLHEGKTSQMA